MSNNGRPTTGGVVQPQLDFLLGKIMAYLLYERQQQTELSRQYEIMAATLHSLHRAEAPEAHNAEDWTQCLNQGCAESHRIFKSERLPQVSLSPFTIEMMKAYEVDVLGNMAALVVKLRKKAAVVAVDPPRPPGKLII